MGVFPAAPLVLNTDGRPQGLYIDLIEYFANSLGWQVEYVDKPWDELLTALRATHLGLGALVLGFTVALSAEILRRAVPAASASAARAPRLAGNGHGG